MDSTSTPIRFKGYVAGVCAATIIIFAWVWGRDIFRGVPEANNIIIVWPLAFPIYCLISCTVGALPFSVLRLFAPYESVNRLAFIMLLLSPTILLVGMAGLYAVERWLRVRFNPYPTLLHPQLGSFWAGLLDAAMELWPTLLVATCLGGLVCWAIDRTSSRVLGIILADRP